MAVSPPDIGGSSLVFVGSFNPAILHPAWFAAEGLLTEPEVGQIARKGGEDAVFMVTADVTVFEADWFLLQATSERLVLTSTERQAESFLPLRDLAVGILTILRHTPVEKMGMNHSRHIGISEGRWDAFSRALAPPTAWEGFVEPTPDLVSMRVRRDRTEYDAPGFVAITIEPSLRITDGVFVSVNDHVDLPPGRPSGTGAAVEILQDHWEASNASALSLFQTVKERA